MLHMTDGEIVKRVVMHLKAHNNTLNSSKPLPNVRADPEAEGTSKPGEAGAGIKRPQFQCG